MSLPDSQAAAYSATSLAWQHGPGRVYDRLAETVVAACPVPLPGRLVLATPERMAEVAASVPALVEVQTARHEIAFPELGPSELVAWRLGMAQLAPFFDSLSRHEQAAVSQSALDRLGPAPPPLTRRILVLTARV